MLFIIGLLSPEPVKQNATTTQNTSTATEDEFNKTFATYGAAGEFSKMYTDLVASDVKATVTEAKFVSDFTALKPCLEALNDAEKQGFSGVVVNYDNGVKKYTFSSDETNNLGDGKTSSNKCTLSWYIKKSSANKWELELGSSVANAKVITTK